MSKSKSKSKSKQATFPDQYWQPEFEIYTYYRGLFDHGKELFKVPVEAPPQDGDVIVEEIKELLDKQKRLNRDANERERRREEIEWEMAHLARSYQTTLLTGPEAYSKTWQLMNTLSDLALVPVMHFKKEFARARPNQLEPRIEPLIEVPGHASYPSGHATQNFLVAHLLSEVIGDDAELIARVFAIARRVAENREYAGLHYASDTRAGEELAREIFPIMRQAFPEPIKDAIEEWQELELEQDKRGAPQPQLAAMYQLQEEFKWDDAFAISHFPDHQWNLENAGKLGGKHGVDINIRGAWDQLRIWQGGKAPQEPVRVALIDLAVDLEHPALKDRFDKQGAVNLDYPRLTKADRARYVAAFGSSSSAHAIACAGIIAADKPQLVWKAAKGSSEQRTERGCLGIAPHSYVVPFRAMTLAEPVRHKRQLLARAVLQVATGRAFVENRRAGQNGSPAHWTVDDKRGRPAHVLLFPLPLEPLPEPYLDPLPLALAFAATRIPVIIPSGNKGTSSLSYPAGSDGRVEDLASLDRLAHLFDLDLASVRAVFGAVESDEQLLKESDQQTPEAGDQKILEDLISSLRDRAPIIWVGACNDQGRRSRYSQYGAGLTLVAPSDDVLPSPQEVENGARRPPSIATTDLKGIGGYMQDQSHYTLSDNEFGFGGTSAAAAQVAGVVALMLQANPRLGPKDVCRILCKTARVEDEQKNALLLTDDKSTPKQPSPEFGHGLADAAGAVAAAREEQRGAAA
jgi:subtilisin family serine protease